MSADARDDDEYTRFEILARQLVNTPKPKAAAEELPPLSPTSSAGEPAADGAEREEDGRDGD